MNALKAVSICLILWVACVYSNLNEDILIARTADITGYQPAFFGADDSVTQGESFGITAGNNLQAVEWTVQCSSPSVAVALVGVGSATYMTVGNIAASATGWGGFQVLGPAGTYAMLFNITYKKGSTHFITNTSIPLIIGNDSGTGRKRDANEETELASRTPDMSLGPAFFGAPDSYPQWLSVQINPNVNLHNVSYVCTPSSPSIALAYPPGGNYIGDIASGGVNYGDFEVLCPMGTYYVNVQIHYKKTGGFLNFYQNITLICGNDSSGERAVGNLKLDNGAKRSKVELVVDQAGAAPNAGFLMGVAVGCVAVVAAVAVVAVMVTIVKRQRQTSSV